MTRSTTFGRLLKMAVNGIATYEGTTAALIEQDLGQQIGLSAAAIQRYKAGHLPPEARTIQLLAAAAVQRGHLDAVWLREFLQAAQYRAEDALIEQLCPQTTAPPAAPPVAVTLPPAPLPPADPAALRNRSRMLARVRAFWIDGVLEQSLHGAALLELGMVTAPQAVERAWDAVVQQPDCPARALPPETPISEVYDELDHTLLILGAPGSGKTTILLELARALLDRAEQDDGHPIPVVFNLSTWHARHGTLAAWLVDELHTRYHVPRPVAQDWIAHDQLLPLLDGLDETAPDQRESCVTAINRYHREHGMPGVAVCSRSGDYDLLQSRLQLQGAVVLQPLSDEQIARYLDGAGEHLAAVRVALRQDRALRELAETPLLLSIMSLAYQGISLAELDHPETLQQRRQHLFETYIQRMFTRRAPAARYAPEQVRGWLHWLARQMQARAQSVFFLEDLQPDWLGSTRQRGLFAAGVGASVGLLAGSAILFIVGIALLIFLLAAHIPPPPPGQFATGLLLLVPLAGLAGYFVLRRPHRATRISAMMGSGSLLFALVGIPLLLLWDVQARGDLRVWLLALLPVVSIIVGGGVGLLGAALRGLGAQARDLHLPPIRPVERLHWSWERARGALPSGVLFGQGLGMLAFVLFGIDWFMLTTLPAIAVLQALVAALTGGAVVGIVFGLIGGLTSGEVELRTMPNQGIHQSAGYALRMLLLAPLLTLAVGLVAGTGLFLLEFLWSPGRALATLPGQPNFQAVVLSLTLYILPLLGVLLALASGGATCVQHAVLRGLLARSGALPWRLVPMLDYAAERLLLRKVGGGYIFVHRLLLEHIATTPPPDAARAQTSSAGQRTIRLPAAQADTPHTAQPTWHRGRTHTFAARLTAPVRWLREGRPAIQRTVARASIGLTLALVLVGGLLAGTQYIPSPQHQQMVTTSSAVAALALTDDGDLLASVIGGWNAQVQLRDGTTGALLDTLEIENRHTFVGRLVFAPGGDVLAVGLLDRVQLWDVPSGTHITTLATTTWWGYPHIAFAPDGRMLVLGGVTSDGRRVLETYDLTADTTRTVGMRPSGEGELHAVAFTSDGTTVRVAWRDGTIQAWNPATGALEQSYALYAAYPQLSPHQLIGQMVLSPDGTYAATQLFDQPLTVAVWQLDGEQARLLHTLDGPVGFLGVPAFSPDGRLLAMGDQDRLVRVWDVADGSLHTALRGHWDGAMHLALTNDGWLATGGQDFTLRLWDVDVAE